MPFVLQPGAEALLGEVMSPAEGTRRTLRVGPRAPARPEGGPAPRRTASGLDYYTVVDAAAILDVRVSQETT